METVTPWKIREYRRRNQRGGYYWRKRCSGRGKASYKQYGYTQFERVLDVIKSMKHNGKITGYMYGYGTVRKRYD